MNIKKLIIILVFTFIIGTLPTIFIEINLDGIIKPQFFPPKILFPIVWTILYVLMSISLYNVKASKENYIPYLIQLFFNSTWMIVFFGLLNYFLGIIWILVLIILVVYLMIIYYKEKKISTYLLIPYLIWLIIALYLNISIFVLN